MAGLATKFINAIPRPSSSSIRLLPTRLYFIKIVFFSARYLAETAMANKQTVTPVATPSLRIPFNQPHMTGKELFYIADAHLHGRLAGDGPYTRRCHKLLEEKCQTSRALLTHSCTAALEMQSLLLNIAPGDEVIMPSFTFVSTANAVVLRGGAPVFIDIRPDTLNINEELIEAAITPRTRAIAPVHYAGVGCEMDATWKLRLNTI